jgi:hypothetical protein
VVRETLPALAGTKSRGHRGLFAQSQEPKPAEGRKDRSLILIVPHDAILAGFEQAHTES